MSLTIELPAELETELTAEAAQLGLTLPEYALRLLATGTQPGPAPQDGEELLAYWREAGLIGSRPDIADSQQHARRLRQRAEQRPSQ